MSSVNWKKYWNQKANDYKTIKERNDIVTSMVEKGKTVLDVGCGKGELMLQLQEKGCDVYGIDFSQKMIKECKKKKLLVKIGNAENLIFPNHCFEVVTALGLIEYLPEDKIFLKEIRRILIPHGTAIISFRNSRFKEWSGKEFEPERRVHDPNTVKFPYFKIDETVFFHEHTPHKFNDPKYYHSGFIMRLVKV